MCGIICFIQRKGEIDPKMLTEATDRLISRGPDQSGQWIKNNIGLGHRRLSIIDVSENGRQPLFNASKSVGIVFNGEIYNYLSLRAELGSDYQWQSHTDTEVLIHGYSKWKSELLQKIEGMFAFALWDDRNQQLVFARDHFGKKPLYYFQDENLFACASEIKALLANPYIKQHCKIDTLSISKYLVYGFIPSPRSIFENIKKLEPGSFRVFDAKSWTLSPTQDYWKLESILLKNNWKEAEILSQAEELITQAVTKRLMADVPIGLFLSGGVDSSLIAACLKQQHRNLKAFTVSYLNDPEADELAYAQRVADHLGIPLKPCYFEDHMVSNQFDKVLNYLDEPMADAAIIPLSFLAGEAKKEITVTLSGDGGDELFGGYSKYKAQLFIENHAYLNLIAKIGKKVIQPGSTYYKLIQAWNKPFAHRQYIFGTGGFLPEELLQLLSIEAFSETSIFEETISMENRWKQKDMLNRSLYLDQKILLPDWYLVKGDRATMMNSMEMRNPFLDKALAEFMLSVPGRFKIKNGEMKVLMKKIASKYLPREVVYRPKKGFGIPLDRWLRKELKEKMQDLLNIKNPYLQHHEGQKIMNRHLSGHHDERFKILRIMILNHFLSTWNQ